MTVALIISLAMSASGSSANAARALERAQIFYDELEYQRCVEAAAVNDPAGADDALLARLELLSGLCAANLGHFDDAQSNFRIALRLDPSASLPPHVSPRIAEVFGRAKAEAAAAPKLAPPPPGTVDESPPRPPVEIPPPALATAPPAPAPPAPTHSRVVPAALGVVGLVALGAGLFLGAQAQSLAAQANAAHFDADNASLGSAARQRADVANGLFIGAGALGVGAAICWAFELP